MKQPTTMRQPGERGQGGGRMKKRIRGMTFASRGEKERKRKREDEMDAVECASGKMVQAREKHCIDITERINEERRRRWAVSRVWQLFRAKDERRRAGYMTMKRKRERERERERNGRLAGRSVE